jgi:arginyl-tRNA--protein-N-Asp/Glu arginylyltransferase
MLKDIHFPAKVIGSKLDAYLAIGWYRIGQIIFTTDYIPHPDRWIRVFWLRFSLDKFKWGRKQTKLLASNLAYTVEIKPLVVTKELNDLYSRYYDNLDFAASPTLENNLFDYSVVVDPAHRVFDSYVIEIRDAGKLIAAGIFDKGEKTLAGIVNFFEPAYRKISPGKWLMLLKIQYALENKMTYYYPGYIASDFSKFDYKLFPDVEAAEIYDPVYKQWMAYSAGLLKELKNSLPEPEG